MNTLAEIMRLAGVTAHTDVMKTMVAHTEKAVVTHVVNATTTETTILTGGRIPPLIITTDALTATDIIHVLIPGES